MLLLNEEASIPLVSTLPADGKPPVVWFNGEVMQWNGSEWIYLSHLTINGEAITIDGNPITWIPYGTEILLNEDGSTALNEDGSIARGV